MSLTFTPTSINPISHGARLILPPLPAFFPLYPYSTPSIFDPSFNFPSPPGTSPIITASHFDRAGRFGDAAADFNWGDSYDEAAAESVFSNFSILLTEEPIDSPEVINMGVLYGEDKLNSSAALFDDEGDEASIDLDDQPYFPPGDKEIDISKHIRDLVHLETTINAVCDPQCKGLCLKCGVNLNTVGCKCDKKENRGVVSRPLAHLRKQMQQK